MRNKILGFSFAAIALLIVVYWAGQQSLMKNEDPAILSGWVTFAAMFFMMAFNARKRLSMAPIVSARSWLVLHVVMGCALLPIFWIHTGSLWPTGITEQIIACLFYLVSISGIWGYFLSKIMPARLRNLDREVIFERIPQQLYEIRQAVQKKIGLAVESSGRDTLLRDYQESLNWFFAKPRFFMSHLTGSRRPAAWVSRQNSALRPFLDDEEAQHFSQILDLMEEKNTVDAHFAVQWILKFWLFIHLPLAAALSVFVAWHILLVHIYS